MTASGGEAPGSGFEPPPAHADHPVAAPPSYPMPGYGPAYPTEYVTVPAGSNRMAIASVISSVLWLWGFGSVIGIVLGAIALNQVKRSGQKGYGLAVAGIAIGAAGVVVALILVTFSSTWG